MVIAVAVPPSPVFLLFLRRQLAKVSMLVTVILARPLLVIDHLIVVPDVVVGVVGVIDSISVVMLAGGPQHRKREDCGQETGTEKTRLAVYLQKFLLYLS